MGENGVVSPLMATNGLDPTNVLFDAELDTEKLSPLLRLKYNNAISDAFAELGSPAEVREVFSGFQQYLYR